MRRKTTGAARSRQHLGARAEGRGSGFQPARLPSHLGDVALRREPGLDRADEARGMEVGADGAALRPRNVSQLAPSIAAGLAAWDTKSAPSESRVGKPTEGQIDAQLTRPLGKGEVVSSILTGSTRKCGVCAIPPVQDRAEQNTKLRVQYAPNPHQSDRVVHGAFGRKDIISVQGEVDVTR